MNETSLTILNAFMGKSFENFGLSLCIHRRVLWDKIFVIKINDNTRRQDILKHRILYMCTLSADYISSQLWKKPLRTKKSFIKGQHSFHLHFSKSYVTNYIICIYLLNTVISSLTNYQCRNSTEEGILVKAFSPYW